MTDFTRRSNSAREMERVAIVAVDPTSRTATGITRIRTSIQINCAFATGDTITTPAVGEQWYVERLDYEWRLYGRIPFNDATLNIEPEEGQVSVGSANGPLELNGTEVRANGTVFRLNGVYYRDDGETLQRSTDQEVWEPISAQAAGVLQLVGYALAGIPGSATVADFVAKLNPADADALQGLMEWASHLGDGLGDVWNVFCDNPFLTALRDLGTGDSPLAQIATGLQDFLDNLFRTLFCDFTGNLTPQTALAGLQGVADLFGNNPLVQGLSDFVDSLGMGTGNLLSDAVTGISKFLEQLFGLFFCDFTGDFTPQAALDAVSGLLAPLIDNPFIQGLSTLADTLGTGVGNLLADAVTGATGLIDGVFRAIFCDFTGDLTPQDIISHIGDLLEPIRTNPFIVGLGELATTFGNGIGNLAHDALIGATNLFQAIFGAIFCDFTGDFTPQDVLVKLTGVLTTITSNPFVSGLISFAEGLGHTVGGGIEKAFAGANELLEAIFGIFFCDNEGVPTPQTIVDSVSGVVDFIRTNPLIEGLVDFITDLGTTSTGFLQKALEGGFAFFNEIVNTLFCNLPGTPAPNEILASLSAIISSVADNPFVVMLRALATHLGDTSTNLIQQVMAGITGIGDFFIDLLNTVFPLLDWDALRTGNFPTAMGNLLNGLNPLAFLTNGKLDLDWIPQIAISTLTGASEWLQSNVFGPLTSQITGGLTSIANFFAGFTGTGSILQQIVHAITGITATNPLQVLADLFDGVTAAGGSIIDQIVSGIGDIATSLDISAMVSAITGIATTALGSDPLQALRNFFTGFTTTGGTLLSQVLAQAGSNIAPLVSAITGISVEDLTNPVAALTKFGDNLRGLFGGFNFNALGSLDFSAAANAFITTVLSQASTAVSALIPAHALANLPIAKLPELVNALTGQVGATVTQFTNFFTNLRRFLGIGSGTGLVNFLVSPGSFNLTSALNSFIDNVLSLASSTISSTLIPVLDITKVNNLIGFLTGKTTGISAADVDTFFANLRRMLNIGTGGGQINLTVTQTVGDLQNALFGVISQVNAGINSFITQTGLSSWLGAANFAEIGNFFTNLVKFFKIGDFKIAPGSFNIATVAGNFIRDVLNVATGTLLNPLKVLGVGGSGTLFGDLSARPLLTDLRTWLTTTSGNATEDIQKFFTNLQSVLGGPVLLPAGGSFGTTERDSARTVLHNVVKTINDAQAEGIRWASQAAMNLRATIDGVAKAILGGSGTYTDLTGVATLFGPLVTTGGTTLLDKLATVITNGTTTLGDFFAGLSGGTATVNSLVHRIVSSITGGVGVQTLASLGTFFGNFSSTATTLVGKVVDHLTGLITSGLSGMSLTNFFSGFNTAATVTGSLAHKIAQSVSGGVATTLSQVTNFFDNLRSFLGIGTSGISLSDFLAAPATFATKLTGIISGFITNVLQRSGVSTTLVTLASGATRLADSLIPDLGMDKITNLISNLTGSGSSANDVQRFFTNLRTFLGGANGFLGDTTMFATTSNLGTAAENFISSVLRGPGVSTKLVSLQAGLNTIAETIVPDLDMTKIRSLIGFITGSGSTPADVQRFFTNLRGLFGNTSWLTTTFDTVAAANQFVVNVLSKATQAGIGTARIAAEVLTDFSVDKVINLAKALTGQSVPGATGDLAIVQRFFSGFSGFDPITGANNLVNQITNAIFGTNGTLANLRSFFSGFIPGIGAFNPADGSNNLANQITRAITGTAGALSNIAAFLGIGSFGDPTTLDPFTGNNSLVNQLVSRITGVASHTLNDLGGFFANLRNFFTGGGINLGSFDPATAIPTFLKNLLNGSGLIPQLNNYSLTISGAPTGGSYRLSYGGQTTAAIGYDASAAAIDAALEGLSSIGTGNITVTGDLAKGFTIVINNLTSTLTVTSIALSGGISPTVTVARKINTDLIPRLGVDWLTDIEDWARRIVVEPMIGVLTTASGINLSALGIDLTKLSSLNNALGALGVWANRLLTQASKIPVANLIGIIPNALLGNIPVANIADTSPNLLTQGAFGSSTTIAESDGWTWDAAETTSGSGGAAKLSVGTTPKLRELFSQQAIPVTTGNQLTLSAYVKTSGLTITEASPISLSLIPFVGTARLTASGQPVTVTAVSTGINNAWTKITGTYTVPAGVTSVIVRLAVTAGASAGTVWFDDVSLTKSGLLRQNLVDRLIDGWNNLWDGLLGNPIGTTVGRTVDSLFQAANSLWQNAQNTAFNLVTLGSNLLNNAAGVIGNIGGVLMDGVKSIGQFLTGLWNGLTGNPGNTTAKTVDQVAAQTASLKITTDNASTAAGLAQSAAGAAQTSANNVKFALDLKARDFSNLSAGSDFEGDTQPWWWDTNVVGFSLDTAQKNAGTRSLKLSSGSGGRAAYLGPYPTVFEAKPDEQFYVEFWVRRDASYSATTTAELRVSNQANSRLDGISLLSGDLNVVDTWIRVSDTVTVPANTTGLIFSFQFGATSGGIWIDDVVIRKVIQTTALPTIPPDKVAGLPVGVEVNQALVDNSATIQELQSAQLASRNQGKSISVSAAQYPAGAIPPDWQVTYSPATGANTVGVSGGAIGWSTPEIVTRSAKLIYLGQPGVDGDEKTDSDFQSIRFTLPSLPEQSGDDVTRGPQFWALGRVSDDGLTYVWARVFWTDAGVFRGEMGCTVNGVEQTPWVTNISLTPATTITLNCGVGSQPRVFELWSGSSLAASYSEPGTVSRLCSANHALPGDHTTSCTKHRRFGSIIEVKRMYENPTTNRVSRRSGTTGGGYFLGKGGSIAAVSVSDSVVPAYNGSVARMSRASSSTVNFPTADTALPSGFFDTPDYETLDIDAVTADGTFEVKKSKAYLVTARIRLSTWFTALCTVNLQVWDGASWTTVQKGNSVWPFDSFHNVQADRHALSGTWIQYLNAGQKIRLSTERNNGSGSVLRGASGGSETYFSISALQ